MPSSEAASNEEHHVSASQPGGVVDQSVSHQLNLDEVPARAAVSVDEKGTGTVFDQQRSYLQSMAFASEMQGRVSMRVVLVIKMRLVLEKQVHDVNMVEVNRQHESVPAVLDHVSIVAASSTFKAKG